MRFIIPGESLDDPLILNGMRVIGLDVIKAPSTSNFPYWYEFVVEGDESVTDLLATHVKPDWYAARFTEEAVTIIFRGRTFDVIAGGELTAEAQPAATYAEQIGIQAEFTDWQERHAVYKRKLAQAR